MNSQEFECAYAIIEGWLSTPAFEDKSRAQRALPLLEKLVCPSENGVNRAKIEAAMARLLPHCDFPDEYHENGAWVPGCHLIGYYELRNLPLEDVRAAFKAHRGRLAGPAVDGMDCEDFLQTYFPPTREAKKIVDEMTLEHIVEMTPAIQEAILLPTRICKAIFCRAAAQQCIIHGWEVRADAYWGQAIWKRHAKWLCVHSIT